MDLYTIGEVRSHPDEKTPLWVSGDGAEPDIVLSTRARLARNLADIPFPGRATPSELARVQQAAQEMATHPETGIETALPVDSLSNEERERLVAGRLISPGFAAGGDHRLFLLDKVWARSVMVNEEDHFRIQCLLPGWQPEGAWEQVRQESLCLELEAAVAFRRPFGYLTASPLNVGTGLRLSAMAHLPALSQLGRMQPVTEAATAIGVAVRGIFGEGTESLGDLYQISNALTLGITEEEIRGRVKAIVSEVTSRERQARREILYRWEKPLQEAIEQARGVLLNQTVRKNANVWQAMSLVRLGIGLGLTPDVTYGEWNLQLIDLGTGPNMIETGVFADNSK